MGTPTVIAGTTARLSSASTPTMPNSCGSWRSSGPTAARCPGAAGGWRVGCGMGSAWKNSAVAARHTAQKISNVRSPTDCSSRLPSKGPSSSSMVSVSCMAAFPCVSAGPSSNNGRLACTAGWNRPSAAYKRQSVPNTTAVDGI